MGQEEYKRVVRELHRVQLGLLGGDVLFGVMSSSERVSVYAEQGGRVFRRVLYANAPQAEADKMISRVSRFLRGAQVAKTDEKAILRLSRRFKSKSG